MKTFFASTGAIHETGAIQEGENLPGVHFFIIKFQKFLFSIILRVIDGNALESSKVDFTGFNLT